ncbi:MAG: hypothetical protein ACU84Q_04665 [Gammaproteobacteria bacterium]
MSLPDKPGIHDVQIPTSAGKIYVSLSVPEIIANEKLPVILVLHYAGQPSPYYGRPLLEYLVLPGFAQTKAIFIAPTSMGGDWKQADNQTAIFELIDKVERHYETDKHRRFVVGYSMGAIGTWFLACSRPNFFRAAIPIAGFPKESSDCETPIYAIVSNGDEIFSFSSFQDSLGKLESPRFRYGVVDGAGHYDISAFTAALKDAVTWLNSFVTE